MITTTDEGARVDLDAITPFVKGGYISARRHPTRPLTIFNYTPRTQYERAWTPETAGCRGLIVHDDRTLIARCLPKFFNLSEHMSRGDALPREPFEVFEKLDGSYLSLSFDRDGEPIVASRGSFTSAQAAMGHAILDERYRGVRFDPAWTYIFEVIYPANRIVVDYGNRRDVVLLTAIHTRGGHEMRYPALLERFGTALPLAARYDGIADLALLATRDESNTEGYVVRFESGLRVKVKMAEYVRLHRVLTGTSAGSVWDALRRGILLDSLLERVPDEFYAWVQATVADLCIQYAACAAQVERAHAAVAGLPTRKEQALALEGGFTRAAVFRILDGRPYDDLIWKEIRPTATRHFASDEEV